MTRQTTRLVQEGDFAAKVLVDFLDEDQPLGPYLTPADARKLEDVRQALRRGDLTGAAKYGEIFRLIPVPLPGVKAEAAE